MMLQMEWGSVRLTTDEGQQATGILIDQRIPEDSIRSFLQAESPIGIELKLNGVWKVLQFENGWSVETFTPGAELMLRVQGGVMPASIGRTMAASIGGTMAASIGGIMAASIGGIMPASICPTLCAGFPPVPCV
jgi:hypothetical protein